MSHQGDASTGESEPSIGGNGVAIGQPPVDTDRADAERAMAAGGVTRANAIWVTECAWCQRVRSVAGHWQTLIPPVPTTMGVQLTHGICPQCACAVAERASRIDGEM